MAIKPTYLKLSILVILTILIYAWGNFPLLVLNIYSLGIYPTLSSFLRLLSGLFPFPIGDICYAILVVFVLFKIYSFLKKRKQLSQAQRAVVPFQILNFTLILYIVFKLLWGLNYSRPSIATELNLSDEKYSVKELVQMGQYFIKKTNALKAQCLLKGQIPSYTLKELKSKAVEAYRVQAEKNELFRYRNPSIKAVFSPYLISKTGVAGYYNPLSGEANLNTNLPEFTKPYVTCHEIAHQLGIAYEDEANLIGYLTASGSSDVYFKYSASYEMMRYILFEIALKSADDYKALKSTISPEIIADFDLEREFWRKYNGQMYKYMDATFDRFLKLNNQEKGINSYQDIVIWLWNIHKNEILSTSKAKI